MHLPHRLHRLARALRHTGLPVLRWALALSRALAIEIEAQHVDDGLRPGDATLRLKVAPRGEPIHGEYFGATILPIFIAQRPMDDELKAGLLGAAPR